jgi:hypothetical protein
MSGPIAVVADYVVAAVALYLGVRLFYAGKRLPEASIMVFSGGLLAMAVATGSAGVAHAVVRQFGGAGLESVWRLSALAVGLAAFCFFAGVVLACAKGIWRQLFLGFAAVKLLLYSFWILSHSSSRLVVWELVSALVLVALLEGWSWISRHARSAPTILAGTAATLAALAVGRDGIGVHSNLDRNMIYHLLILGGLWLLFDGGRQLHDRLA